MMPEKREEQNSQMIDRLIEQQLNNALVTKRIREESKRELEQIKNEMVAEMNTEISKAVKSAKEEMRDYVDAGIEEVRKIVPLSDGEAAQLKSAISSRAQITTKAWLNWKFGNENYGGRELFSKKYGHIIGGFYTITKKRFNAIKYTTILHVNIEEAIEFANSLNIHSLKPQTLRITDKQLEIINKWEERHNLPLTQSED